MDLQGIKGLTGIHPDEPISSKKLLVVIYANPGVGKTSLSATAPKPFLCDYDNGVERANRTFEMAVDTPRPFTIKIKDYQGMRNLVDGPLAENVARYGYQTAILDTGGTLLDNHIAPWLIRQDAKNGNNTGGLSIGGWGSLSIEFNSLVNKLQAMGLHVIVVCHAKHDDGDTILDMKGGSKTVLNQRADMIGYIEQRGDGRHINWDPRQDRIGKNTAGLPDMKIPEANTEEYTGFMERVIEETNKRMQGMTKAQKAAIELTNTLKEQILNAETYQELDEREAEAADMSPIYRNTVMKAALERWVQLYGQMNFDGLSKVKEVNDAMLNIKKDIAGDTMRDKHKRRLAFDTLIQAVAPAFEFDAEKKKFVSTKNKKNENAQPEQDDAGTGELFDKEQEQAKQQPTDA